MISRFILLAAALLPAGALLSAPAGPGGFSFQDGDMVVQVGNTFVEREQNDGYIERALILAAGEANVKFRNLGWSGDTVYGDARSYFGPPEEGFERLSTMMGDLKPDVVFLGYGAVAAFEGQEGLDSFITGYERLLDMIQEKASPREMVLMTPPPAESLGKPLPDMTEHNQRLALYSRAIQDLAKRRELRSLDLFTALGAGKREPGEAQFTFNGVHLTPQGYERVAPIFVHELGLNAFEAAEPDRENMEKLRRSIVDKNRLYFHRWRPANETYLNLFRKHEQGQNAKELPMFEPLVAEKEDEIKALKSRLLKN